MALVSVERFLEVEGRSIDDNVSVYICGRPASETTTTKGTKIGGKTKPCGNPDWINQRDADLSKEVWVEQFYSGIRVIVSFDHLLVDVPYHTFKKLYM